MANTAVLVFQGHNRLRYRCTADEVGGAVTIANDGGASPDLQTDALAGPIRAIARSRIDGYGILAAGARTQAQARSMLLADEPLADLGTEKVARCICRVTDRAAGATPSAVDANVDGDGDPTVVVTLAADAVAYLDIEVLGAIGA
jgi:hypothetical protein